jgi:hypothetical protein
MGIPPLTRAGEFGRPIRRNGAPAVPIQTLSRKRRNIELPRSAKSRRAAVTRRIAPLRLQVTLEQFNPKKTIELKTSDIIAMHRKWGQA